LGFSPIVISGNLPAMGLKQILQDFSWETLWSLPPSDLLALLLLPIILCGLLLFAWWLFE
jgi:hypothetical protein